jgi:hypothetical protein
MAKLSTEARKAIPAKSFAEPDKRKYPIENQAHAKTRYHEFLSLEQPPKKLRSEQQ